jgi:tetratricopeptide (TPR) repeat protein
MPEDSERERSARRIHAAWDSRHYAYAVFLARDHLKQFPNDGYCWHIRGMACIELGRQAEARASIRRAVELAPANPKILRNVHSQDGHLHALARDYDEAVAAYRRASEADPSDAGPHIYMGGVFLKSGKVGEAEEAFRRATQCEKGCIDEAYFGLGQALRTQDRHEEAADCYRKALEIDPKYATAAIAWGEALLASERLDDALDVFKQALSISFESERTQAAIKDIEQTLAYLSDKAQQDDEES